MPTVRTFINDTGVVKELTGAELEAFENDRTSMRAEAQAQVDAKAATRASAFSKLKALGLTDAEVAALVGG